MSRFSAVHHRSSPDVKIALFRSLFRGRDDVYPRRFESRTTGKSGYAPACGNEWVRGICEKPRVKCATCVHRQFLSVTDEVIRWHLSGQDDRGLAFVAGVYPMMLDETCFFLAIDLDKTHWQDDALAILQTCQRIGVPGILERSRSGNGGHVWICFDSAVPTVVARRLGSHILTETMEARPEVGLESYDRFFPSQDTMPRGGFGNLIALPLQKMARAAGNSVFVDDTLQPWKDQWAFLASVERMPLADVESIVRHAGQRGRIVGVQTVIDDSEDASQPWNASPARRPSDSPVSGPLPKSLELIQGDQIYIAKKHLSPALHNRLIRVAAFQNPEFHKAQSMRLPTWDKPRIICCAEDHPQHIALPRGCLEDILPLLNRLKIEITLRDERNAGEPLEVSFRGELRPEQRSAGRALLAHDTGVLAATTAFGKTVVASWLIAERAVNTLVLVHRRQLLEQWVDRLSTFLSLPTTDIGRIGGGRRRATGHIDVAIIQSVVRKGEVDDCVADYGHVIVDECHHLSARSFELVARRAKAKYVTGLTATVTRKDGHHPIILMQCGPVRHRVDAKAAAIARPFEHTVVVRPTSFQPQAEPAEDQRVEFQQLYQELIHCDRRNRMICDDVRKSLREGRSPLVLTERREHLDRLAELLTPSIEHVVILRGGTSQRESRTVSKQLEAISEHEDRVLLATGRYIGEGFDDPRLDTLFLTLPVSWRGTIAQYAGRLHRLHDAKREVLVYDYADINVPMLSRMFDRRCEGYESVGYRIQIPGSAVPGWPADIPLPVDPVWKRDYAASVRRLIQDGVDAPLANLFVHASRSIHPDSEGAARARSASEAFLFRRLKTLPATAGLFQLNADLPIPFDGRGKMEVDFLCQKAKLVIELDGQQHLSSEEAYRRDRRKDALLQEQGYFVLRFLARDIGSQLDAVLDTVLRALTHRRQTHPE